MPRGSTSSSTRTRTRSTAASRTRTRTRSPNVVRVAALGEDVRTVAVQDGATIFDAVSAAFKHEVKEDRFDPDDGCEEIRMNNKAATLDTKVVNGAVITLVADIDGG